MRDYLIKPQDVITGAEKIISIYGRWPDMHDFEVLKVVFERDLPDDESGPFITVFIHMWHADNVGYSKHTVVGIRFNSVLEHRVDGFNRQNVIDDMAIRVGTDNDRNRIYYVTMPGIFGFDGKITCRSMEVVSVEPGAPKNSQYA